ncbi:hypothetical protein J7T55_004251 [Diaporthe amygdali]|uniref:uncharacterized protein n=1 Tax=Phomopsis amygdali TaxID=1214568 RepID=UPI0022FDC89D|nr:uncharacterized protein J7T55_004251 [Diaporthe amygdali]KAJ0103925.1 hypothetical protein J7T55_004251 [Diaporthe amygdali]
MTFSKLSRSRPVVHPLRHAGRREGIDPNGPLVSRTQPRSRLRILPGPAPGFFVDSSETHGSLEVHMQQHGPGIVRFAKLAAGGVAVLLDGVMDTSLL